MEAAERVWLEGVAARLKKLAWDEVAVSDLHLCVDVSHETVHVSGSPTGFLLLAAACLEGALTDRPVWTHAVDKASYADETSFPLKLYLGAASEV